MGREVKRVPLDFEWEHRKIWHGYLSPDSLDGVTCPSCVRPPSWPGETPRGDGYAPRAQEFHDLWYGHAPFRPEDNGSKPLTPSTPAVRAFADRNVVHAPDFYGRDATAGDREALRLATMWNGQWSHHLNADDVAALVADGRLRDFTHAFTPGKGWHPITPTPVVTAEEVNTWHISSMGHDSINAMIVIQARCEREGVAYSCATCDGHGTMEAYPGQRADAEAWERTGPPNGEGWQLWETVSEGSPVSPVFASAKALALWLTTAEGGRASGPSHQPMTLVGALRFVEAGWAPSMIADSNGVQDGAHWIGHEVTA